MKKSKKNEKSKSIHYGFYFGLIVVFILLVSFAFKIFDSVKKSEFDGNNFFSIAVINGKNAEIVSLSPKDGTLKKLTIRGGGNLEDLNRIGIPYDKDAESKVEFQDVKTFFSKLLLNRDGIKSELTTIDAFRLFIYSQRVGGEKLISDTFSVENISGNQKFLSEWFMDPEVAGEKKNIEITNYTEISGLGNKFASIISNMGGNVVLVNSSPEALKKSVIYFNEDSYTAEKLSKLLDIPLEKKEMDSISDIIVSIGEDKSDF